MELHVHPIIASLFVMLNQDIYVLIRIEFLVALVTVMFLVMFVMDIYRCRSRDSTITTTIMKTVDGLSDHILVYLLGAMHSAGFENQLFPVWGIVLVNLHRSLGYLSRSSILDREGLSLVEVPDVIKYIGAGVLTVMHGLEFANPRWWFFVILQLRSMYRYFAHRRAVKSLWHGRSSEFLPEYLRIAKGDHHDWSNNSDYIQKYLVYGESNQKINIKKPQYVLHLDDSDRESLITLDKIWKCSKPLLSSSNNCRYKDMSLAFSLSRLLRCRLEDVPLHSESISGIRYLITSEIIGDQHAVSDAEAVRAFRILELELAFLRDYFYTFYPMVFWRGLFSLSLILLQSIATFLVALWLAVIIHVFYKPDNDDLVLWVGGCNVDVITTWVFMLIMMFKEVWEMVTYLLSNWTGLLLVCKYVRSQCWCLGNAALTEKLTSSFFTSKIADPWHGHIDQYEFLQSYTYKATFWKLAHTLTLGKTPTKFDGMKPSDGIKISPCVKAAVLEELRHLDLTGHQLPRDSLNRFERYEWAFLKKHTCSQVILVWHIATSLCEIALAQEKEIDLSKPGFLRSVWSCHKKLGCCSSHPFLIDESIHLQGRLQTNYRTANSLSRYCAYLQVFQSELLPDSFTVPELIFKITLQHAREILKDCDSPECRYDILMVLAQEAVPDSEDGNLSMNILQQGAKLAKDLIDNEDVENRWKILAGVWAGLLVHIAPSWNAEAHKYNLEKGGEFITLIWALLWHCGIEKSRLWHEHKASESNAQAPQENSTETRNTQFVEEEPNEDGIDSCEEPEISNFRTDAAEHGQRESEAKNGIPQENSTDTSNITSVEEQENEDGIEISEEPKATNFRSGRGRKNAQTDTEEQDQTENEAKNRMSRSA